ncbi:MAG: ATP-binding cassette domain-containing protein [Paracoccaceae bacterium]
MLEVTDLSAGYGNIVAVRDFLFSVGKVRILALLGANGAGRTSTLMSLVGLVERKSGTIRMDGEDISSAPIEARITKGLAIVPEGRRIFPDLTVRENLMVGGHIVAEATMLDGIERVYGYFRACASGSHRQPVRCRGANNRCSPWVAP